MGLSFGYGQAVFIPVTHVYVDLVGLHELGDGDHVVSVRREVDGRRARHVLSVHVGAGVYQPRDHVLKHDTHYRFSSKSAHTYDCC